MISSNEATFTCSLSCCISGKVCQRTRPIAIGSGSTCPRMSPKRWGPHSLALFLEICNHPSQHRLDSWMVCSLLISEAVWPFWGLWPCHYIPASDQLILCRLPRCGCFSSTLHLSLASPAQLRALGSALFSPHSVFLPMTHLQTPQHLDLCLCQDWPWRSVSSFPPSFLLYDHKQWELFGTLKLIFLLLFPVPVPPIPHTPHPPSTPSIFECFFYLFRALSHLNILILFGGLKINLKPKYHMILTLLLLSDFIK